ncbi:MAG TPA: hypothetical protein VMT22_26275, partial [Terriglobales bacterium]|nr:hypothetical protein [Terriglobales bacterium]
MTKSSSSSARTSFSPEFNLCPGQRGFKKDKERIMGKIRLTLACWDYDRTRALQDGRVEVEG